MKKNKIIEDMTRVVEKNNRLYKQCEDLKSEITEKDAKIEELKLKIASLEAEIEIVKAVSVCSRESTLDNPNSVVDENESEDVVLDDDLPSENTESREVSECNTNESETKTLPRAKHCDISSTVLPEFALKLASESIGRVVVKCAELCNHFATAGSTNSKDLINLALGRTEVFKSDLLSLVSGEEQSEERLSAEIKLKETDVSEYFDLLLSQL